MVPLVTILQTHILSNIVALYLLLTEIWIMIILYWAVKKKMAPTCEQNVQIKLTPKNFLLIIFNVVYIEVNETRKKLNR